MGSFKNHLLIHWSVFGACLEISVHMGLPDHFPSQSRNWLCLVFSLRLLTYGSPEYNSFLRQLELSEGNPILYSDSSPQASNSFSNLYICNCPSVEKAHSVLSTNGPWFSALCDLCYSIAVSWVIESLLLALYHHSGISGSETLENFPEVSQLTHGWTVTSVQISGLRLDDVVAILSISIIV